MERKLAIYETTHVENLSALLELCEDYFSEITIFIPSYSSEQLQYIVAPLAISSKIIWVTQGSEDNRAFIRKVFRHLQQSSYTHLHIGTLEHNLILFAANLLLCRGLKISITIHSLNEYKNRSYGDIRGFSESVAKMILKNQIKHYRVLAPEMEATFKHRYPQHQVCFIPGNFFKPVEYSPSSNRPFHIVIPGTVAGKRRNYAMVIKFLQNHIDQLTSFGPIQLTLAGNADSTEGTVIINKLIELTVKSAFHLTYYTETVNQQQYETLYRSADVIWAPVIVHTRSLRGIAEISAVTHSPGFITDQIYFGKPAIVPKALLLPSQLKGCNFQYDDENDLQEIFYSLLSNKNLIKEANLKTTNACTFYKKENFIVSFHQLMDI